MSEINRESLWARLNLVSSQKHEDAGGLVKQLAKQLSYARAYNLVMTIVFVVVVLILATRPTPVMTVDASGNPVGQYEWFNAATRNEYEVMASAKRFVQHYTSLNATTIFEDAAIALNAMCEPLKQETKTSWKAQGYLARINNAGSVSRIEFDDERSQIVQLENGQGQLRLIGTLTVGVKQPETSTFDIALHLKTVPRTPTNTLGVEVCAIL